MIVNIGLDTPILFPIVGRLKMIVTFIKSKFNMSQHGFTRDKEFEIINQSDDFIEFRLCSDEKSLEIYPFSIWVSLGYKLEKILW